MATTSDLVETMLRPTDGSDGALAGANRGIALAGAIGEDVHVLSVVDNDEIDTSSSAVGADDEQVVPIEAESAVETVAAMARERHLEA